MSSKAPRFGAGEPLNVGDAARGGAGEDGDREVGLEGGWNMVNKCYPYGTLVEHKWTCYSGRLVEYNKCFGHVESLGSPVGELVLLPSSDLTLVHLLGSSIKLLAYCRTYL